MTQFEHNIVAIIVLITLWHLFIKKYFVTEKKVQDWQELMIKWFNKNQNN